MAWMDRAKINPNEILDFVPVSKGKTLCKTPMLASQFFKEMSDLFGRPTRRFYEFLMISAKDEKEKAELRHLLSKDGNAELKEFASKK